MSKHGSVFLGKGRQIKLCYNIASFLLGWKRSSIWIVPSSSMTTLIHHIMIILQHDYSLIISDSNVDDACQTLELFLESYWAFTRSVILVNTLNLTSGSSIATSAFVRPKLAAQTTIDATVTTWIEHSVWILYMYVTHFRFFHHIQQFNVAHYFYTMTNTFHWCDCEFNSRSRYQFCNIRPATKIT